MVDLICSNKYQYTKPWIFWFCRKRQRSYGRSPDQHPLSSEEVRYIWERHPDRGVPPHHVWLSRMPGPSRLTPSRGNAPPPSLIRCRWTCAVMEDYLIWISFQNDSLFCFLDFHFFWGGGGCAVGSWCIFCMASLWSRTVNLDILRLCRSFKRYVFYF